MASRYLVLLGVPVQNKLYWGGKSMAAGWKMKAGVHAYQEPLNQTMRWLRVVGSRSHVNAETVNISKSWVNMSWYQWVAR